jgi:hypothetical protein
MNPPEMSAVEEQSQGELFDELSQSTRASGLHSGTQEEPAVTAKAIAAKELRALFISRVVVCLLLLIAAAVASVVAYQIATRRQAASFETTVSISL